MHDDDPALGIVMGVILLIAAGVAFAVWMAPTRSSPNHIYYCCRDGDWSCAPCKHIDGPPVSVSDQPHIGALLGDYQAWTPDTPFGR